MKGKKLQGTKWSHVNTGRTGFNTLMDAPIIEEHLQTQRRNMGDGFLKLAIPDYANLDASKKGKPINIGGRMMFPDVNGVFTIIDSAVVNKMASMEEEKRQYLESLIEKCSLSNEICQLVLGMEKYEELEAALGAGNGDPQIMHADLIKVGALPSQIESYDPTSLTYSQAIQKFKIVIKHHLPILDDLTPAKTFNQEA